MTRNRWLGLILLLLAGLGAAVNARLGLFGISALGGPEPVPVTITYTASDEILLNPERGLYTAQNLLPRTNFSMVRLGGGNTLIRSYVRLDKWRETDLPESLLTDLNESFAAVRSAGVKVIVRFAYNQGPYPNSQPDASQAQMLRHIEQLKPLLQTNADVIAWLEAGFIGAWGEWHTSTHGLDQDLDAKREILTALLNALPETRMVQLRYPTDIIRLYGDPLTEADAFSGSDQARVGHHNDCFLASADDQGTYNRDGQNTIETDQAYLAQLSRFTPTGGETCGLNPPRSDCPTALAELERLHFTELNEDYHPQVIHTWEKEGCLAEIERRLGYRLVLKEATFAEQVKPGGIISLTVALENIGFASLINPRPIYVVVDGPERYAVPLTAVDPRRWEAGRPAGFSVRLRLPARAAPGIYRLALWLPDAADSLRDNPLYAARLANVDIWDEDNGFNVLSEKLRLDPKASGSRDANAAEFSVIPAAP